jgi:hypothetical protein
MREHGIVLEVSGQRRSVTRLPAIQAALRELGVGIWPLDLSTVPESLRRLLREPSPTGEQKKRLLDHFLLPRERLLETIAEAGRQPHVPGGGELTSRVESHGYSYPQLFVAEAGTDFSRFDRFHVNHSDAGVFVDEVGQMLCGAGFAAHYRRTDGVVFTLRLSCPSPDWGWLITHEGSLPHIGSFSAAAVGTKCVVQVIGPPVWSIHYLDA